jgi:hypothetical protein
MRRLLGLVIGLGLLVGCGGNEAVLPTLAPVAQFPGAEGAVVGETAVAGPAPTLPADLENYAVLASGTAVTRDPAQFATYQAEALPYQFRYPPEMVLSDEALMVGLLLLQAPGGLPQDPRMQIMVTDAALYANQTEPTAVLRDHLLPTYENAFVVQEPLVGNVGLYPAASAFLRVPAQDDAPARSVYLAVITDGRTMMVFTAEMDEADERAFLPVASAIVQSTQGQ